MADTSASESRPFPRLLHLALFITAMAWAGAATSVAGRAANGIATRFSAGMLEPLLTALFLLFLVVVGYRLLDWIAARGLFAGQVLPLPKRSSAGSEWSVGVAVGWGIALAVVLPVLLSGHLHAHLSVHLASILPICLALATLLVACLAEETIFRGYAYRRLAGAVGESWAAVLLSLGFAITLIAANPPRHTMLAVLDGAVLGLILTMAWLRTHGLWLGWGLHFGYRAIVAVVLGLPIAGHGEFGALTDSWVSGPRWLSGGVFGLDAALLTAPILLAGMAILYRVTREYAWQYTHAAIVAGGYEVAIAPPAAHVAMEKAAAPPALVQILSSTPQSRSREDFTP